MPQRVELRAPATSANLGPGFDCLGMALDIFDTVTLEVGEGFIPGDDLTGGHQALILLAASRLYQRAGLPAAPLRVVCDHQIPVGRGMGSSAAAIVAGVVGANALAGSPLAPGELALLCAQIEGHPDNSTPCLTGGLQACVLENDTLTAVPVPLPSGLEAALFIPDFPMPTHETRKLLPKELSRADVVFQVGHTAVLVAALAAGRLDALRFGTQDKLHQPARGQVFGAMFPLFDAALEAGALCAYLSGGGPTVLALTNGPAATVAGALAAAGRRLGVNGEVRVTRPTSQGAHIVTVQ
jgi:homoserine kinase